MALFQNGVKTIGSGGYKNMFFNNGFQIWQRGTDSGNITGSSNYGCDGLLSHIILNGTWQIYQSTDVPANVAGLLYSIALKCHTPGTHNSRLAGYKFYIEGANLQPKLHYGTSNAQYSTLSFYVKSNVAGNYNVVLDNLKGFRAFVKTYTISSADTWQRVEIVVPPETVTGEGYTVEHGKQLGIGIYGSMGSTYKSGSASTEWHQPTTGNDGFGHTTTFGDTANDEMFIAGLQYEVGDKATDVEILDYTEVLRRCQRHYYTFGDYGAGNVTTNRFYSARYSTSGSFVHIDYPVTMSKNPTLYYSTSGGAVSTNYSNKTHVQLYDSDDPAFYIYDVRAEANL